MKLTRAVRIASPPPRSYTRVLAVGLKPQLHTAVDLPEHTGLDAKGRPRRDIDRIRQVLHREERIHHEPLTLELMARAKVPYPVRRKQPNGAVGRAFCRLQIVAELIPHPRAVDVHREAPPVTVAEPDPEAVFRSIG